MDISLFTKSACPYRRNTPRLGGNASHIPEKREVKIIFGGTREVGSGHIEHLSQMFNILRKYRMKLNPLKCAFGVRSGKFIGFIVNQLGIEANPENINALLEMSSPRKPKEVMSFAGRVATLSRFVSRATDCCAPFFEC